MKIAILVAMRKELDLLLPLIDNQSLVSVNGIGFHTGTLSGRDVIVSQCGIGKVNAAVAALTVIESFHPSVVINTGVAGGVGRARILDVVIPSRVAYHDVWCGPGTEPGVAADMPATFDCPLSPETIAALGAHDGLLASGDSFVSTPQQVEHILELYPDAVACDMESAAIAQVCHIKSVPFICVRVVSDTPGQADNIAQYENFWSDAPANTFRTLTALIEIL